MVLANFWVLGIGYHQASTGGGDFNGCLKVLLGANPKQRL